MFRRLNRRMLVAVLCVVVPVGASVAPALAGAPAPSDAVEAVPGPITMASLQVVNALSGNVTMTLWVDGKVRARGVPPLSSTSPIVVSAGRKQIRIAREQSGAAGTGAIAAAGSFVVDALPGSQRTVFVFGTPAAPRKIMVDASGDRDVTKQMRLVDLRTTPSRTPIRVNGLARAVDSSGVSAAFAVSGPPSVTVDGVTTAVTKRLSEDASLLFVADSTRGAVAGSLIQPVVGVDSLRSQVVPVVVTRVRQSLVHLVGSLALVGMATVAAVSSMLVFRSRSREDRVRNLMARSFGL